MNRSYSSDDRNKKILTFDKVHCYEDMMGYLDVLCNRYSYMEITTLGHSIFNRKIPMISLGEGKKTVVYVGAVLGTDIISSIVLLRFINEYCEIYRSGGSVYNLKLEYLSQNRKICIIPMLNPDGVDYVAQGVNVQNPFYERLVGVNGNNNFSQWRHNARGVDLRNNFDTPMEPEPETSALQGILRFDANIKLLLEFGCGGDRISYVSQGSTNNLLSTAKVLGRVCGMALSPQNAQDYSGNLISFCDRECGIPAYSVFFKDSSKIINDRMNIFKTYAGLRELLFMAPALI